MTDQEDNFSLGKIVWDHNNQETKSWACLGKLVPDLLLWFCPNYL